MPVLCQMGKRRKKKKKRRRKKKPRLDDEFRPFLKTYIDLSPCDEKELVEIQGRLEEGLAWKEEKPLITSTDWKDPNWISVIKAIGAEGKIMMSLLLMSLEAGLHEEFATALMSNEKIKTIIKEQGISKSKALIEDIC